MNHDVGCVCEACMAKKENDCGCGCGCDKKRSSNRKEKETRIRLCLGAALFAVGIPLHIIQGIPAWSGFAVFLAAYLVLGLNVLLTAGKNIARGKVFDEHFLMAVATIGAFVLGEYMESAAVMLFYLAGETLSDHAVQKSRASIAELMDIRPDYANIEQNGILKRVVPESVAPGDVIIIKPFEKVPLDSVVLEGASTLNTSALTGESIPRDVAAGDTLLAGSVNGASLLKARVEKEYGQSTAAKILEIVEHASSKKARTEKFITRFARYYTPCVCAAALAVAILPSLFTGEWSVWVYRALLFLVISCPCALVVAAPLSYFGGIGGASKSGILVKGANYLEALARIEKVVFDKTGTLTRGVFSVREVFPAPGHCADDVLGMAAAAEAHSPHPIAKSIREAYESAAISGGITESEDIPGYGARAVAEGKHVLAGGARLMEREGIGYVPLKQPGTALYVAVDGTFIGSVLIADEMKADAEKAVRALKDAGISAAMLTGDGEAIGRMVASEAGINEFYAELLPQDKVAALEEMSARQNGTAFVGDGINDAPVLARADVGIAMGALGSDAAIEAADVVLMTDEPSKVPLAIKIARKTKRIVWQNIVFALAVKAVVMALGVMGIADMWAAVFADVGVTLIAVLNALRALRAPK